MSTGCNSSTSARSSSESTLRGARGQRTRGLKARGLILCAGVLALAALPFAAPPRALAQQSALYPDGELYQPLRWDIEAGASITQGTAAQYLDNGWTLGGGVTWYPSPDSPLGLRADLNYSEFGATNQLLYQSSIAEGTQIDHGTGRIWGGDIDAVINAPLGQRVRGYLLGGIGMYQRQIELSQTLLGGGYFCDPWWGVCGPGFAPYNSVVSQTTSDTHFAWNAGAGLEFPLNPITSLFIEARFMRINPADERTELVPVTVGLRF